MSRKDPKTIGDSLEETREYHLRYLRAVNTSLRRKILTALKAGDATIETLQSRTGLDARALEWHPSILEHGFCVEKEVGEGATFYTLTQEGKVVDYMKP